jgi:hypothetical protein
LRQQEDRRRRLEPQALHIRFAILLDIRKHRVLNEGIFVAEEGINRRMQRLFGRSDHASSITAQHPAWVAMEVRNMKFFLLMMGFGPGTDYLPRRS